MNWHLSPQLLDRLAGEYVLGTMHGGARRRFQSMMQAHAQVARAAARWETQLEPMNADLPAMQAGDALWSRIAQRSFGTGPARAPASRLDARAAPSAWAASVRRWLAPIPAAALSMGLMLGVGAPLVWQTLQADRYETQLPESYVGVLATADGKPGLIVSSLRRGKTVDLKVLRAVPVPPDSQLVLWTLDANGVAQPVGPLPALAGTFVSLDLGRSSEEAFSRAVELAVSVEAAGATPAAPSLPYVYRGLCGKLWRPAPPR